jgi:hypothetical protein
MYFYQHKPSILLFLILTYLTTLTNSQTVVTTCTSDYDCNDSTRQPQDENYECCALVVAYYSEDKYLDVHTCMPR